MKKFGRKHHQFSCVYVITPADELRHPSLIGRTDDIAKRMSMIQFGNWRRLRVHWFRWVQGKEIADRVIGEVVNVFGDKATRLAGKWVDVGGDEAAAALNRELVDNNFPAWTEEQVAEFDKQSFDHHMRRIIDGG